jgi:molybdopterin converting factor small subunit
MNVTVRYFAAFREATGCETELLATSAASPAELFSECAGRHAGLQSYSSSLVAINDEMAGWEATLKDGDEVLFFPPVAGG